MPALHVAANPFDGRTGVLDPHFLVIGGAHARPLDRHLLAHDHAKAPLRLQESLLEEARRVAEAEGVALNQFINVAVAEKLSALRTEDYFRERARSGSVDKAKRLLKRAGHGNAPLPGDELK